jgi:uncharacterized protein DUF6600
MRTTYAAGIALSLALLTGIVAPPSHAELSFDVAYSDLSPHGSWLVSAQYGRVWQPQVYESGWNPYYDGHWAYTDLGWSWVSDYEWGAIPYHYGTWTFDPAFGWVWVPGTVWAPAWVVFRTGPEGIGWAPVAPGFSVGLSFAAAAPASSSFVFVSTRDFAAPRIRSCVVPEAQARTYMSHTTVVNNLAIEHDVVVNRGPDVRTIERASGRTIRVAPIEDVPRVAPFRSVQRAQLAVAPDRAAHGVRAAEPVSAKHPLPQSTDRAAVEAPRAPHAANQPPSAERVAPAPEAPKREAPKHEAPNLEAPKPQTQRVVAPKPEAPKPQPQRVVAPKPEAPKPQPQKAVPTKPAAPPSPAKKPAHPQHPKKDSEPHPQQEKQ